MYKTFFIPEPCEYVKHINVSGFFSGRPAAGVRGAAGGRMPAADGRTWRLIVAPARGKAAGRGDSLIFSRICPAIRPAREARRGGAPAFASGGGTPLQAAGPHAAAAACSAIILLAPGGFCMAGAVVFLSERRSPRRRHKKHAGCRARIPLRPLAQINRKP